MTKGNQAMDKRNRKVRAALRKKSTTIRIGVTHSTSRRRGPSMSTTTERSKIWTRLNSRKIQRTQLTVTRHCPTRAKFSQRLTRKLRRRQRKTPTAGLTIVLMKTSRRRSLETSSCPPMGMTYAMKIAHHVPADRDATAATKTSTSAAGKTKKPTRRLKP